MLFSKPGNYFAMTFNTEEFFFEDLVCHYFLENEEYENYEKISIMSESTEFIKGDDEYSFLTEKQLDELEIVLNNLKGELC